MMFHADKPDENEENIFWVTMSDLLLGLLVIFIALFAMVIVGFSSDKVKQIQENEKIINKINAELVKNNIKTDINPTSGIIKISDLELFEVGKSDLSLKGKQFLNKFIPIYFNSLLSKKGTKENISEIIIEGHTDIQSYKNAKNKEENYIKNMDLSLKRAQVISNYIVNSNLISENYKKELFKLLSVNGKSYSKPVFSKGKMDLQKSRRVEFKIMYKN